MSGVERFPHIQLCTHKDNWDGLVKRLDIRDPEFFHTIQRILVHQAEADDVNIGNLQGEQVFVLQKKPCRQYMLGQTNEKILQKKVKFMNK